MHKNIYLHLIVYCALSLCSVVAHGQEATVTKIGVIGLDTSHAPAFAKIFNDPKSPASLQGFRVVAAYPQGSSDIESSYSRIPKYTRAFEDMGVEIVDSVATLLAKSDVVLLETNDGKPHLAQAIEVFRAGKPVFIDKPCAADLASVLAIYEAGRKLQVPVFSSSSLRFNSTAQSARGGQVGEILACDAYSPCALEPSHSDLFWYGIHGCEMLFTVMGAGCTEVRCWPQPDQDFVVGRWEQGRIGTFRGMRSGKVGYGGTAFGTKKSMILGPHEGYQPLVVAIAEFFRTGVPPVDETETIELYAFMEAARLSKQLDGQVVVLSEVLETAQAKANQLLREYGL